MAANQGLPRKFLTTMKQSMDSSENIACFLDEMNINWLYSQPTDAVLKELLLLTSPFHRLLELTLSYGAWAAYLTDWLERTFPLTKASDWRDARLHIEILHRVQDYLHFEVLLIPNLAGERQAMANDRSFAKYAPLAINLLLRMKFSLPGPASQRGKGRRKSDTRPSQANRELQQKEEEERGDGSAEVLQRLDLAIPRSEEEAITVAEDLALKLKGLLTKCLAILQTEGTHRRIRELFIANFYVDTEDDGNTKPNLVLVNTEAPAASSAPSPLFSQPLKAALYFDSASGFGQWEIIISNRGIRDIRTAYKKNRPFFDIVMKKIKELSNAHFSEDNQKRLNKGNDSVPVFEAKMTGDARLVYQIDCISEYHVETKVQERQVIRIFGIYNHTQLNRIWDTLGFQLAQKGREYLNRCSVRTLNRDKTLVISSVFPPNGTKKDDSISNLPQLPKEDLEEIHSILVLEKFVTFSQELRNSILAELDVQHVFNMSPQEMEIIEHPFSCYVLGRSGTGKTTTMMFKMLGLERAYKAACTLPKPRQLFVTQSRVLASRVEEYFEKLVSSLQAGEKSERELQQLASQQRAQSPDHDEDEPMLHLDDDTFWKAALPTKFSLLEDGHFPLFLTFERLLELITADLLDEQDVPPRLKETLQLTQVKPMLDYPRFLVDYWVHFPQDLIRGLDPALVFSEIIGVIKGSEKSLTIGDRYLDEATYLSLGERTNHVFASQRPKIYKIFLKYLQTKRDLGDYDSADRTHRVLQAFDLLQVVPGTKVDFLYVDEAQDNMLIDAMLLRSMCRNPQGLFWAGDTAQTISVGNSFRFEDLKAFLYRLEERRLAKSHLNLGAPQKPSNFILSTNYRSHGGIVSCAHSIIEVISTLWPTSLDNMAPEQGIVNGLKPLFFGGSDETAVQLEAFLTGGKSGGVNIEFGARQCILVRDKFARSKLRQRVGKIGIAIMTIYESKGLEFDDVLLYQFFEDSAIDFGRWRVLSNFTPEKDAPKFSEIRHAGLCTELKFLYVAVTRARRKLWIYDSSSKSEPMRALWAHNGLIENFKLGSSTQLPQFAEASTPKEWMEQGRKYFDMRNFSAAAFAFEQAGSTRRVNIAQAYQNWEDANIVTDGKARRTALLRSAEEFLELAQGSNRLVEQHGFRTIAGRCFEGAKAFVKAAEAYREAEDYNSALRVYRQEGMFDEGVQVIKDGEQKIEAESVKRFKDIAKLYYLKDKEIDKACDLFESAVDALAYLEGHPFLDESYALLLEKMGEKSEAVDVHLAEGRVMEAVRILMADEGDIPAISRGYGVVIQELWRNMAFGTSVQSRDSAYGTQLLQKVSATSSSVASKEVQDQLAMFSAIQEFDLPQILAFGIRFFANKETMSGLLCFGKYFHPANFPDMRNMDNVAISHVLADLLHFCEQLQTVSSNAKLEDVRIQRLFNFQRSLAENTYSVPVGTFLYEQIANRRSAAAHSHDAVIVPGQRLLQGLRNCTTQFIATIIQREIEDASHVIAAFTPCLRSIVGGHCASDERHCQHLEAPDLKHEWLLAQIRIHLQQVLICQKMESIFGDGSGRRWEWMNRLYQTLNPPAPLLGSWSAIEFIKIPEAPQSSSVMKSWCRYRLFGPKGSMPESELSGVYLATDLSFFLDGYEAGEYVHRSSLVSQLQGKPAFMGPTWSITTREWNGPRVPVLPKLLQCLGGCGRSFLTAGVLFIRHVIKGKLFIDANILCNFVDFLCGSFVMACRRFNWNNVFLPRSLCLHLLRRLRPNLPAYDTRTLVDFVGILGDILEILATGHNSKYLTYEDSNIDELRLRGVFLPRIYRAMCLVGGNVGRDGLRNFITKRIKSLSKDSDHLRTRFEKTETWTDIQDAIWTSTDESILNSDMVHLCHSGTPRHPIWTAPFTTLVIFRTTQEIPNLLRETRNGSYSPTLVPSSKSLLKKIPTHTIATDRKSLDPGQAPSTKTDNLVTQASAKLDADFLEAIGTMSDTETITEQEVSIIAENLLAAAEVIAKAYKALLKRRQIEQEIAQGVAAKKIMEAYQALLKRRKHERNLTSRELAYRNFFQSCVKHSDAMEWPVESTYKWRYFAVVPHLLVCVQWIQACVSKEKAVAKKAFNTSSHTELESAQKRMDEISDLNKTVHKLQKMLQPQSPFHRQRDMQELDRVVGEVEVLLALLPRAFGEEVALDIKEAKRWSFAAKKKAAKPVLTVEDDLEDWVTH